MIDKREYFNRLRNIGGEVNLLTQNNFVKLNKYRIKKAFQSKEYRKFWQFKNPMLTKCPYL